MHRIALILGSVAWLAATPAGAQLTPGDLVVTDRVGLRLWQVRPTSGEAEVFSPASVATNLFTAPSDVATTHRRGVYVADGDRIVQILSFSGATDGLVSAILSRGLSVLAVVALMMLILVFLGIFIDQVSMMLITLPVFMPLVAKLGIDPIWFGVLFLICMQLGLLLPPHGLLLMTMRGVAPPEVTFAHIFQAVTPYVIMSLLLLALILLMPGVATWLPSLLIG